MDLFILQLDGIKRIQLFNEKYKAPAEVERRQKSSHHYDKVRGKVLLENFCHILFSLQVNPLISL